MKRNVKRLLTGFMSLMLVFGLLSMNVAALGEGDYGDDDDCLAAVECADEKEQDEKEIDIFA